MRLRDILRAPINLIAPPTCQICGNRVEDGSVCEDCNLELARLRLPICCYRPLIENIELIFAVYRFDSVAADVVHLFKYSGNMEMGKFMAKMMAKAIEGHDFDLITEVPLFVSRRRERGFSQTELLARWISGMAGVPERKLLRRNRYTPPQARLKDHSMRIENVRNAFELIVPASEVDGRKILLVDDVTTSGATLNEAARPLVDAGAETVSALVFAVAG